jgi:carbon-monoxide dehydrogenase large subunit
MLVMERLIDLAAREHGFDPIELRRRNLIPASEMPYLNPFGLIYDSGDYEACMARALDLADWAGLAERRKDAERRGLCRGIGVSNYIEVCTGATRERTEITVLPEGRVEMIIGTQSSGQGHETAFAQLLVEWLGVPFDSISLVMGDTDIVTFGGGSHSGRSMRMAGIVVGAACDEIIRKARRIAAHELETAEADIELTGGRFSISGTDRSIGLFEVAAAAMRPDMREDLSGRLSAIGDETRPIAGFPYGAHVCEVEVDPATGQVEILNYVAVDDVGRAINPRILHGQAHGGVAHGVGQALMEKCHYEPESGELLSASLLDYSMPRASDFPAMITEISEVRSPTNQLGIRAGGEGGTTPALAVMANAVVDALAVYKVEHVELPLTPERVWQAIEAAGARAATSNPN